MRHLTFIAMLTVSSVPAQAKCVAQICYAVTFDIAACRTTLNDGPPRIERKVNGIVLSAKQQPVARAVPCDSGLSIPEGSTPTLEQIEGETDFFYPTESCGALVGRSVTLFAAEPCCHDTPTSCSGGPPERILRALPIWAQ